jgi:hypothetical protein
LVVELFVGLKYRMSNAQHSPPRFFGGISNFELKGLRHGTLCVLSLDNPN